MVMQEGVRNDYGKFQLNFIGHPRTEQGSGSRRQSESAGITLILEYRPDLFDEATIVRMVGHYTTLLKSMIRDPEQRLRDLPILTEAEQQLFVKWNEAPVKHPKDQCIHELFEAQVERTPDRIAVVYEGTQLSYREVNQRANQLAHRLKRLGGGPEGLGGICLGRPPEMVRALLAILKAGGAYVPLDPAYPRARVEFMLHDAKVKVILTEAAVVDALPEDSRRLALC